MKISSSLFAPAAKETKEAAEAASKAAPSTIVSKVKGAANGLYNGVSSVVNGTCSSVKKMTVSAKGICTSHPVAMKVGLAALALSGSVFLANRYSTTFQNFVARFTK